jgi:hypothetical protein
MVETVEIELTISLESPTIPGMEEKKPQSVDYYYKVDSAYRVIAANSILTTVTPDGQIKIDFVIESLMIPDRLTFEVGDSKTLSAPIDAEPKNRMQRQVQGGVLLTVDQADVIAGLMKQLVAQIRAVQAGPQKS